MQFEFSENCLILSDDPLRYLFEFEWWHLSKVICQFTEATVWGFIWIKPISLSIVGVCVLQRLCTPTQTLGLLPCGSYPVNHSDCVFLSVSASVLVLAPDGGRPLDSHLTLLPQLQTGRKNGSIDSLHLVGSVSFLCELCPTFSFFNVMEVNGSELYFVVS